MKITKLIEILEQIKQKYGDIQVWSDAPDDEVSIDVNIREAHQEDGVETVVYVSLTE